MSQLASFKKRNCRAFGVLISVLFFWSSGYASTPLLITIDTETSAGCYSRGCFPEPLEDRVLGKRGDSYFGIPLMMDILEKHGQRATFFVDPFMKATFGDHAIEAIVKEIVRRGHDVQFHSHEEQRCLSICKNSDLDCWKRCTQSESYIAGNTLKNQLAILHEGAEAISRWTGKYPLAFRGGAFDADKTTLQALHELGIPLDFSLSGPDHELAKVLPVNRVGRYNNTIEVPVFKYREDLIFKSLYRHLDIESTTLTEFKDLLSQARELEYPAVVVMMHSFSFCRPNIGCPIPDNVERFEELVRYASESPDFELLSVAEFWDRFDESMVSDQSDEDLPSIGYFHTLQRSWERFDQGYKNRIFLLANIGLLVFVVVLSFIVLRAMVRRS